MERIIAVIAGIYVTGKALIFLAQKINNKRADKELARIITYLKKALDH